jgi:hypothetical protein
MAESGGPLTAAIASIVITVSAAEARTVDDGDEQEPRTRLRFKKSTVPHRLALDSSVVPRRCATLPDFAPRLPSSR